MSLLAVGPVMFGGTDGIISYLRARKLLARNQELCKVMIAILYMHISIVNWGMD